jgi:hypothetical protein
MLRFFKDPDAILDFLFDWSDWLNTGESIASHTITISGTGLTLDSSSENSGIVTAWLSGGTSGIVYSVTCNIVTDNATPRTDERTMKIRIQER